MADDTRDELTRLADAYLAHQVGRGDFAAWEAVDKVVRNEPDRALPLVLRLIARCSTDEALAYVAAGPLEDLLTRYGLRFSADLETASRRDAKVRRALAGVWLGQGREAYDWHHQLLVKCGVLRG